MAMFALNMHGLVQGDSSVSEASPIRDPGAGLETVQSDENGWHSVLSSRCAAPLQITLNELLISIGTFPAKLSCTSVKRRSLIRTQ